MIHRNILHKCLLAICLYFTLGCLGACAAEQVDYVKDIFPVLEKHCIACHSADEAEGGFSLESFADLMQGGDTGMAVTSGVPASSRMLLMASGKIEPRMPPDEEGLDETELAILTQWIDQGAVGPQGNLPIKRVFRIPKVDPDTKLVKPITSVAVSPNGKVQAVARFNQIDLQRTDTPDAETVTISGDFGKVNSVQFNRDGTRILIATGLTGAYGVAAVYSVDDGSPITEIVGHRDVLYAAVFSPDENIIATAGYDRIINLWNAKSGEKIRELQGHNGAIFDLAFSPDGKVLVSACADETVKVWNVQSGQRLDTLGQPEGEVYCVDFTPDGQHIVAGSRDNRLRVWRFVSKELPERNPLLVTRFIDESPIIRFTISPELNLMVVMSQSGNLKTVHLDRWTIGQVLDPLGESGSDLQMVHDPQKNSNHVLVSTLSGKLVNRVLTNKSKSDNLKSHERDQTLSPIYLDLGELTKIDQAKSSGEANRDAVARRVPRGVEITGVISAPHQQDRYHWRAAQGEVWAIDADAIPQDDKPPIDPLISILDSDGSAVVRVRLQATQESYFTFRGKDSNQINDFRLFGWLQMHLNDYLYASGEVTRLGIYPRGPDSGFDVYPMEGKRRTYFGTTHTTHALGEPCYIVRALSHGEQRISNGLPVFEIVYENDDDPTRVMGSNSRLIFHTPADGIYTVEIRDARNEGGPEYTYRMKIRAATPSFDPSITKLDKPLHPGSGREFQVHVNRLDGFDGSVTFDLDGELPPGVRSNLPLTIETGQKKAVGMIWIPEDMPTDTPEFEPVLVARAEILGRVIERSAGPIGKLKVGSPGLFVPSIQPSDRKVGFDEAWTLKVRRGETVTAKVILRRADQEGDKGTYKKEVSFGKEYAGRNASFGVYVDHIGLNGLLVRESENEREFSLTADPETVPGKRSFFLSGAGDGPITTQLITVEVLP